MLPAVLALQARVPPGCRCFGASGHMQLCVLMLSLAGIGIGWRPHGGTQPLLLTRDAVVHGGYLLAPCHAGRHSDQWIHGTVAAPRAFGRMGSILASLQLPQHAQRLTSYQGPAVQMSAAAVT
jgi:hypothetical protein